ncbi:MAG: ABC transporter permease [Flavobacteriaceae bacterium]|nr:ABC transporter permease [Flavobacteriaceae bacterium]NNK27087.1 ABC transporter permease [Flavobacteriaceae bacterium]
MNIALYIAKRYLLTKSSNNAINIITIIAAIGVIIGAASLFIVLSGFAGLKDFSLQFSTVVDPDLKAVIIQGKSYTLSSEQEEKLQDLTDVAFYTKTIEERIVLSYDNKKMLATLKGVDSAFGKVNNSEAIIAEGSWVSQQGNQVVSGWGITNNLSMGVMDYAKSLTLLVPRPGKGQITSVTNAFNSVYTTNVGVFQINEDLDNSLVFTNLETAKNLLDYENGQISSIEFKLAPDADEEDVRSQLAAILGDSFAIKNRMQLNDALYKMLNTENTAVYLIFTLVLIIALFNVVGSIVMMILDKKKNLNTLFNLGVTIKELRRIFFLQGSLLSIVGGVIGVVIGFLIIILQKMFSLYMITPSLPYPVSIKPMNFLLVLLTISVLGILASKIASSRISRSLIE